MIDFQIEFENYNTYNTIWNCEIEKMNLHLLLLTVSGCSAVIAGCYVHHYSDQTDLVLASNKVMTN